MTLTKKEKQILNSIVVASENDPLKPEFPANDPKFPATSTYKIKVPGFSNVWLKDESTNPTGTHKDRMAWEIVVTYRDFLFAKENNASTAPLPQMSLITSGSAGVAIQTMLNKYSLPDLKVLIDKKTNPLIINGLKKLGCEIFQVDLSKKALNWFDVLKATNNPNGFDITSNKALDPTMRFYDWLSYEIINASPDYCFIPFGTGNLFENILNINKKEVSTKTHDPRFRGNTETLRNCNFMGATTNNPNTKADKLYSPHLPFVNYDEQWIKTYKQSGFCGPESEVHLLEENFLDKAIQIAKENNITCEPSGIAGLGLFLQLKQNIPRDKKILIVNTGKTKLNED